MRLKLILASLAIGGLVAVIGATTVAEANHSWGGYHWARTVSPLTLKLADNVSTAWDSNLALASSDWSLSSVLDTTVVNGGKDPRKCRPTPGRVDVCNASYGNNGWLGIASIWVSGGHITQGTVKMNDTYFKTAAYNTLAWKNLVMCQEIGHTFGLNHQDEDFNNANLGTCMDYTNDPSTNQHPNLHDYEELEAVYAHLDATNSASQTIVSNKNNLDMNDSREWGEKVRTLRNDKDSLYVRHLGNGEKVFTFVTWAE